ncbi:MAG TPA: tRNA (adenosine(37)-N6)-threonylcarbamoyltransferase complex dimerization subunit type 1 TsaB [Candidatus Paceibacterota bacterium]|nr:tRNA (adenosine(37)-N6)-threonylcarbamoyltransferase complex dimerization subunit type 1 TsaB [Candidatus Paceibacterota bacterium]
MNLLAIDFSSPQRSVAVSSAGAQGEVLETDAKATNPFGMIDEALRSAELRREEIECLVVGLGPGSYTGIRASLALAQGWQLARGVKLLGISSAMAVAAQAQVEGMSGAVTVVIDAQRGEFYLATYQLKNGTVQETEALKIVSADEVRRREQAGEILIGPEITRWFPSGKVVHPRASSLARLAATQTNFVSGETLEPIYLRETTFVKAPPPRVL